MKISKYEITLKRLTSYRVIAVVLLCAVAVYGSFVAYAAHDSAFDTGDGATFYSFARNIAHGEIIYKDFIHFRTPGSYFTWAPFISVFGDEQASVALAINFETRVLFPLTFLAAAMIVFWRRKFATLLLMFAAFMVVFLPPITQLRAGLAFLSVAVYMASMRLGRRREKVTLFGAGFLAALAFIFGQETALMALVVIGVTEIIAYTKQLPLGRIKYLALGFGVGLLPLLVYVALFSSLKNFLYYTIYYAFVQQPKFMDLPYPPFSYQTLIYFLPFVIYWLCYLALFTNKKRSIVDGVLLSFGILRLVTLLGRSDTSHLLFSIAEMFVIVPLIMLSVKDGVFSRSALKRFIPYGAILILIFAGAIHVSSACLLAVPILVIGSIVYGRNQKDSKTDAPSRWMAQNIYMVIGATFVLLVYLLFPSYKGTIKAAYRSLFAKQPSSYRISGLRTDAVTYKEVNEVTQVVREVGPKTIFSFPIQPFYYSLADNHAARFMTFEPQTTDAEQEKTIEDIKRTKPEVVIFDPLQAGALSGSVDKISNYLMSNYTVKATVRERNIIWVMVPAESKQPIPLVFNLYGLNSKNAATAIESPDTGVVKAIAEHTGQNLAFIPPADATALSISITIPQNSNTYSECGMVRLIGAATVKEVSVCSKEGSRSVSLEGATQVELVNKSEHVIIWNDASFR